MKFANMQLAGAGTRAAYRPGTGAAYAVGLLFAALSANAADWSLNPRVGLRGLYNDNYKLTDVPADEIEASGAVLDAQLALRATTPRSSFELTPRLNSTFFPDEEDLETDNQFIRLSADHRSPRTRMAIAADYARVEILRTYLAPINEDAELGRPRTGEGITPSTLRNREERVGARPSVSFDLSRRFNLGLDAEFVDVAFDREIEEENESYNYLDASAALAYRLSSTASLAVRGTAGQYEPKSGDTTEGYGLVAEWSNRISEQSRTYLRGGFNRVQIVPVGSEGSETRWENGFSGGAGIQWAFEVTNIFLDATHNVDPTPTGRVVTRDQVQLQLQRRLQPRTTAVIGVRGVQDSGIVSDDAFVDRAYATAMVGFRWRMTERFILAGDYTYTWLKYDNRPDNAQSNSVSLGVVYAASWR